MEKVDNDDDDADDINFDNQNVMGDPNLVDSSSVDQVNTKDDSVGCFKSHTGLSRGGGVHASGPYGQQSFHFNTFVISSFVITQASQLFYPLKHTCIIIPNLYLCGTGSSFLEI